MDKVKISGYQAMALMSMTVLATNILFLPSLAADVAGRDAWMTPIVSTFSSAIIVYITSRLVQRFPEKNLIEFLPMVTGKVLGKTIGFCYLLFFFYLTGTIARESIGFVAIAILPNTPPVVILSMIVGVAAFAVYNGIEVITRANNFIWLIFTLSIVLIIVLVLKEGDINNITPMFDNGILPVLKGSLSPTAFRSEITLLLLMLAPIFNIPEEIGIRSFQAVIKIGIILTAMVATNSFVFEHTEAARMFFPTFELARMINIANFLERVDPVVLIVWISGNFIKIAVFYYMTTVNLVSLFSLKDHRPLVLPTGVIIVSLAILEFPSSFEIREFLARTWPFFGLTFELVLPLLIFSVALIRKKELKRLKEDN